MIEIKIKVENERRSQISKVLCYEEGISLDRNDKTLTALVAQAVKEFGDRPEDVYVTCRMTW